VSPVDVSLGQSNLTPNPARLIRWRLKRMVSTEMELIVRDSLPLRPIQLCSIDWLWRRLSSQTYCRVRPWSCRWRFIFQMRTNLPTCYWLLWMALKWFCDAVARHFPPLRQRFYRRCRPPCTSEWALESHCADLWSVLSHQDLLQTLYFDREQLEARCRCHASRTARVGTANSIRDLRNFGTSQWGQAWEFRQRTEAMAKSTSLEDGGWKAATGDVWWARSGWK